MPHEKNIRVYQGWEKGVRYTLVRVPSNSAVNFLTKGETESFWN